VGNDHDHHHHGGHGLDNHHNHHHSYENRHERFQHGQSFYEGEELEHNDEKWICTRDHSFDQNN